MNKLILPICRRFSPKIKLHCRQSNYGPSEFQRSKMMNGINIAAAKTTGAQMASCTIMFQAGSRYEVDDQIGASHFVRATSCGSGRGYTGFSKMRFLTQHGSYLTCSTDRQSVAFTLRCPPSMFPELKYYLLDTATRICFHEWEMSDTKKIIRDSLSQITPEQRVLDLIQRACFVGPLQNSVFCEEERLDEMSGATIDCFVRNNFRSDGCSVASVGIPFEETIKLAESIDPSRTTPLPRQEIYSRARGGFEFYDLGPDSTTWIAVAVPGCGTMDLCCLLKHTIVAAACGTGNMTAGQHELDRTPQSPLGLMAGCDIFREYRAFNISYKDVGLFGILAKTRSETAREVAFSAAEFLSNVGDLDFKQIDIGKKRLMVNLALHDDDCVKVSEGIALQIANNHQIDDARYSIDVISKMTPDDISSVAKMLSSKRDFMSVAVVGDIGMVPDDREIMGCLI